MDSLSKIWHRGSHGLELESLMIPKAKRKLEPEIFSALTAYKMEGALTCYGGSFR